MTWMLTINSREHELTPGAAALNTPTIAEIAHSLALINRFTGHTFGNINADHVMHFVGLIAEQF